MSVAEFMASMNDLDTLFRRFHISIAGSNGPAPANGQATIRTCTVRYDPFDAAAIGYKKRNWFGSTKNRKPIRITVEATRTDTPGAHQFNAYYIPMVQLGDVANGSSHYILPTDGYCTHMVTSALTGCTVAFGSNATGATLCSHVQPVVPTTKGLAAPQGQAAVAAKALEVQNRAQITAAAMGGLNTVAAVAEREAGYAEKAAVMGVLNARMWEFYIQSQSAVATPDGKTYKRINSSGRL